MNELIHTYSSPLDRLSLYERTQDTASKEHELTTLESSVSESTMSYSPTYTNEFRSSIWLSPLPLGSSLLGDDRKFKSSLTTQSSKVSTGTRNISESGFGLSSNRIGNRSSNPTPRRITTSPGTQYAPLKIATAPSYKLENSSTDSLHDRYLDVISWNKGGFRYPIDTPKPSLGRRIGDAMRKGLARA